MGRKYSVLVVDDDVSILRVLKTLLSREGFEVVTADGSQEGLDKLKEDRYDLLLSDIVMQPFDGIALLKQAREINPDSQVIMMTGFATIETATEALKLGAFDYICKPFKIDELLATVQRSVTYIQKLSGTDNGNKKKRLRLVKQHFDEIVGESSAIQQIYKKIEKLSEQSGPILILGEPGTGKSLAAKAIHNMSAGKDHPFISINCSVYPDDTLDSLLFGLVELPKHNENRTGRSLPVVKKGFFEIAKGGTLFFQHIDSLPIGIQKKIVRILGANSIQRLGSKREVAIDTRIIMDTVVNLGSKVERGEFDQGLFNYVVERSITMPTLAKRQDDFSLLIKHFEIQLNKELKITISIDPKAEKAMRKYSWPGNVRELKNTIYRSSMLCKRNTITINDLPVPIRMCLLRERRSIFGYTDEFDLRWQSLRKFLRSKEKEYVDEVVRLAKGDKEKAARLMDMSLSDFYKKYGDKIES